MKVIEWKNIDPNIASISMEQKTDTTFESSLNWDHQHNGVFTNIDLFLLRTITWVTKYIWDFVNSLYVYYWTNLLLNKYIFLIKIIFNIAFAYNNWIAQQIAGYLHFQMPHILTFNEIKFTFVSVVRYKLISFVLSFIRIISTDVFVWLSTNCLKDCTANERRAFAVTACTL